jgi:hypothetical protein
MYAFEDATVFAGEAKLAASGLRSGRQKISQQRQQHGITTGI